MKAMSETSASLSMPHPLSSAFIDHSPVPMLTADGTEHIVRYVNAAFCRLMEKSAQELLGKSFCEMLPEMHTCTAVLTRVLDSGKPETYVEQQPAKPGPAFWSYTVWPMINEGQFTGVVIEMNQAAYFYKLTLAMNEALLLGSVRQHELAEAANASNVQLQDEIRERKQAEDALQETQTQLIYHAGELEALVASRTSELTKTNQQLEAFVYSIAHDLRAPLRAMQGLSEILVDEAGVTLNAAGKGYADRINQSAQFMDAMLCDLLEFSRISQRRVELGSVRLATAIETVLFSLQMDIQENNVRVEGRGPWPNVLAHERTLTQVLINLIRNALKFVEPGVLPQVRLRVEEQGEFMRIWVEDNGIGIATDHQEQIFGVFTRLNADKYPGTGIGLAIVQKGIERMGGKVGVESVPHQGSRFWFELRKA